ncbi:MAG TPA: tRNA (adenosine(37)-N6)-threonylcarbamoyltransferase complex dimerization subunit type 1 TsaB [Dongiaceae bacterium]
MTNRSIPGGTAQPSREAASGAHGAILALETGGRACSVAITVGSVILAQETVVTDHGQATLLMPMIERVRSAAGYDYAKLDRIAVAVGPGSFTGLRVGIAAALGLSLATGVPAVGISSFHATAAIRAEERADLRRFVLLDSRRDEPFLAELDAEQRFVRPPVVVSIERLDAILASAGPAILTGDAPILSRGGFPRDIRILPAQPNAIRVAALAADPSRRYDLPPEPVYVRPPDVTLAKSS